MKRAVFAILALGSGIVTVGAQVNRGTEQMHLTIMTPAGPNIGLAAIDIQRQAPDMSVVQLKGNVEIKTKDMTLRSDEAAYNINTGEIEARGVVHIKLETER